AGCQVTRCVIRICFRHAEGQCAPGSAPARVVFVTCRVVVRIRFEEQVAHLVVCKSGCLTHRVQQAREMASVIVGILRDFSGLIDFGGHSAAGIISGMVRAAIGMYDGYAMSVPVIVELCYVSASVSERGEIAPRIIGQPANLARGIDELGAARGVVVYIMGGVT